MLGKRYKPTMYLLLWQDGSTSWVDACNIGDHGEHWRRRHDFIEDVTRVKDMGDYLVGEDSDGTSHRLVDVPPTRTGATHCDWR